MRINMVDATLNTSTTWKIKESAHFPNHAQPANADGKKGLDVQSLIKRLGSVPHFKGTPEPVLKEIVFAGQVIHYAAGSFLYREEEPAGGLYVLFKGQVNLCRLGLNGQAYIITIIRPVTMFNEITVIDGKPNPVTAIAAVDCTAWQVSHERYQMLMQCYPVVGTGLLRVLAERNRLMLKLYEDVITRPVLARVAKLLLDLSQDGRMPINRYQYTNPMLAALAATVPEAVSRSIKTLKTHGCLECTRAQIKIHAPENLYKCAMLEPIIMEPMHPA
jgi:CRP/FNR family transcriptional regulator